MKYAFHLILFFSLISCALKKNMQQETVTIKDTNPGGVKDSICYKLFFRNINSFLDVNRPGITMEEERTLIPCCMSLIASGDTIAKRILYQRLTERVHRLKQNEPGYVSIYRILNLTLAKPPEPASLELAFLLFEESTVRTSEFGCLHPGYFVFKSVIQKIVSEEQRVKYQTLHNQFFSEALQKGMEGCTVHTYVYNKLKPILDQDKINGNLVLRSTSMN